MKKKVTNRNMWSTTENQTLIEYAGNHETIVQGIREASKKLGRSFAACNQHYYKNLKTNKESKIVKRTDAKRFEFKIKSFAIKNGRLVVTI